MANRQSSKRAIDDDIWKFLDQEEPDTRSFGQVRDRTKTQPSKEFLKPAAFRSSIVSGDGPHFHDIQLPTFAQKFSGNVLDGSMRHVVRSPFRLPRTVFKEDDEDPNAIYALPKKLPRATAEKRDTTEKKRDSLTSFNFDQGFFGSLFKRYEAGSILSTVSTEHPPVVYHDRLASERGLDGSPELYGDNVVFSEEDDLYSKPNKRLGARGQGNAGGRVCGCCSRKVVVAVVLAVFVAAAVVAIAVGVSLSLTKGNNSDPPSSNSTDGNATVVTNNQGVTGTTTPSKDANAQTPTSPSRNGSTTNSVSIAPMASNKTTISVTTATSPLHQTGSSNPVNSTSVSDNNNNNSRTVVSASTPPSHNGTTMNGVPASPQMSHAITNSSASPSLTKTTSEIFSTLKTTTTAKTSTTNPDGTGRTSVLGSVWTSVSALFMVSTTLKVPDFTTSQPSVTTSQAKSSLQVSTTSEKHSVSSSISNANMTSADNSVGNSADNSLTSQVASSITSASASATATSTSTVSSQTSSGV